MAGLDADVDLERRGPTRTWRDAFFRACAALVPFARLETTNQAEDYILERNLGFPPVDLQGYAFATFASLSLILAAAALATTVAPPAGFGAELLLPLAAPTYCSN